MTHRTDPNIPASRLESQETASQAQNFDELFRRICSPESRKAAEALFAASSEDLRRSYQPGKTEAQ